MSKCILIRSFLSKYTEDSKGKLDLIKSGEMLISQLSVKQLLDVQVVTTAECSVKKGFWNLVLKILKKVKDIILPTGFIY